MGLGESESVRVRPALRLVWEGGVVAPSSAVLFTDGNRFFTATGAVISGINDRLTSHLAGWQVNFGGEPW